MTSISSSLSPDTPLVGPFPLQQPDVEVVASSADPAAAGIFLLDLGMVLKSCGIVTSKSSIIFCCTLLPSLIEENVGSLGDDRLLVSLGDAAIVKVVPVTICLVLAVSSVYKKRLNKDSNVK